MSERRWWMPVFQRCTLMRWEMCWEPGKGLGMDRELWLRGHTDTVFPRETDLTLKKEGERYSCPGIGDDTRAVAELLSLARAMNATGIRGEGDIVFCANVCEEGLGDLRGIKHVFRDMADTEGRLRRFRFH